MRKSVILSLFLMLALWPATCGAAPEPQEFKSEAGRFAVTAPVALKETTQPKETRAGKVEHHRFRGMQGETVYSVNYVDYHPKAAQQSDPEKVLDYNRDAMVGSVNGKLVFETKLTLEGNPGRELLIDIKGRSGAEGTAKIRLFMVKNRFYQVMVVARKGAISAQAMDDFLKSFRLLGQ